MTFFSLNSTIYSEFHSVFLDINTTKLEGRSSFHPASPCNLPPGKTMLRNECSSHNGLKRQPPLPDVAGTWADLSCFFCFAGWSHQKGNWRRTGFILRLLSELFETWKIYESFGFSVLGKTMDDLRWLLGPFGKARSKMEVKNFQAKWIARSKLVKCYASRNDMEVFCLSP